MRQSSRLIAVALCAALALTATAQQPPPAPPAQQGAAPPAAAGKSFSQGELDRSSRRSPLYPDALLAQVLMASTYPLEGDRRPTRWATPIRASRTRRSRIALQAQRWDASVKIARGVPASARR